MTRKVFLFNFFIFTFLFTCCNSIEPLINGNGQDTTSHNFNWQTWTFGEHSSSVLNDVAIIDENNIWAVGEIYLNDSLGQPDPHAYNAVHWDGTNWELRKIYYYGSCSAVEYPPLRAIWAFSENNIILTNRGSIGFFDGNNVNLDCRVNPLLTSAINKIWGTSSEDLYIVGNSGNIAHYNGTSWQKIESGTDLHLYDIYGDYSEIDGNEILVTAADRFVSFEKEILKISNTTTITPLVTEGIPYSIREIWYKANNKYYVCGSGLFTKNNIETSENWEEIDASNYYLE